MKKYAAVAAIVVAALAATGCTATAQQTTWTPIAASPQAAPVAVSDTEPADLVGFVQDHWNGDNIPDAQWIETTALLACKHMIGGEHVTIDADNKIDADDHDMLVTSARKLMCGDVFAD